MCSVLIVSSLIVRSSAVDCRKTLVVTKFMSSGALNSTLAFRTYLVLACRADLFHPVLKAACGLRELLE